MRRSAAPVGFLAMLALSCLGGCRRCAESAPFAKSGAAVRPSSLPALPPSANNAIQSSCGPSSQPFPNGPTIAAGQKPLSRTTHWAPGIPGGIPERTKVCKTLTPNGSDSDDGAINDAIKDCPDNQVVKLEPGTYRIKHAISWKKSNVVLRGSGGPGAGPASQTRLVAEPSLYGPVVNLGFDLFPHPTGASTELSEDAPQGTDTVTVASAARFHVGDLVLVDMLSDPKNDQSDWIVTAPAGSTGLAYPYAEFNPQSSPRGSDSRTWFMRPNRPIAQMLEIAAIEGAKIRFSSPFHLTFDRAHSAQVTAYAYNGDQSTPLTNSGLEDVYVAGLPAPGSNTQQGNVSLKLAKYSWVKNVESDRSNGESIGVDESFRCVVRDSYLHSTINPNPGGAGYGLEFSSGAADNLAENNISWNFNKVMLMRAAGGGNVVAYNYMDDGYIAYQPNWVESGLNAAHMTHSHYELFEGNLSFSLATEDTWGNASFVTWLRNLATAHRSGWPPLNTTTFNTETKAAGGCTPTGPTDSHCIPYTDQGSRAAVTVSYGHVFYNFIGNVLGFRGMPKAPQREGFVFESVGPKWPDDPVPMWMVGFDLHAPATDEGVVNTLFRDGNYDFATKQTQWNAEAHALPASFYLCERPKFFGSYAWPWVDGGNAAAPYLEHAFRFFPLSPTLGTFEASGEQVSYPGFQLPAFVRFLELHAVEAVPASCKAGKSADATAECRLLLTGFAP